MFCVAVINDFSAYSRQGTQYYFVFLCADLIVTQNITAGSSFKLKCHKPLNSYDVNWLQDFRYHTSSLRSMSPSSGRDMDHWLRQSSNIITFKTVLRICCKISGCSSRTCRNMSLGVGTPLRVFFPVKIIVSHFNKIQHFPHSII
jgi:hypothetical protein